MPGSKGILTEEEIWAIVLYIRHLPPAGSLGEPPVYNGDDCTSSSQAGSEAPGAAQGPAHPGTSHEAHASRK
jgi:hypothetical protein